jgi:hypothetical protein
LNFSNGIHYEIGISNIMKRNRELTIDTVRKILLNYFGHAKQFLAKFLGDIAGHLTFGWIVGGFILRNNHEVDITSQRLVSPYAVDLSMRDLLSPNG